jgi:hypothetical protein
LHASGYWNERAISTPSGLPLTGSLHTIKLPVEYCDDIKQINVKFIRDALVRSPKSTQIEI